MIFIVFVECIKIQRLGPCLNYQVPYLKNGKHLDDRKP